MLLQGWSYEVLPGCVDVVTNKAMICLAPLVQLISPGGTE